MLLLCRRWPGYALSGDFLSDESVDYVHPWKIGLAEQQHPFLALKQRGKWIPACGMIYSEHSDAESIYIPVCSLDAGKFYDIRHHIVVKGGYVLS